MQIEVKYPENLPPPVPEKIVLTLSYDEARYLMAVLYEHEATYISSDIPYLFEMLREAGMPQFEELEPKLDGPVCESAAYLIELWSHKIFDY